MAGEEKDDKVGYKKPPKHTRFKPGQSGNLGGRPRGRKREPVDVAGLLDDAIAVKTAGATRRMSGFEVGVRKLVSRAVKDEDLQAALEVLRLCERYRVTVQMPAATPTGGVLMIPRSWNRGEWMKMFETYGPPPWPGRRSGLPGS